MDPFGLSWLDIVKSNGHIVPSDMVNPHGHHIVFKGAYKKNPDMRTQLNRSRKILKIYNIDINDPANLMVANNGKGVHTVPNAEKVADILEKEHLAISDQVKDKIISHSEATGKMKCKLQEAGKDVFGEYR